MDRRCVGEGLNGKHRSDEASRRSAHVITSGRWTRLIEGVAVVVDYTVLMINGVLEK